MWQRRKSESGLVTTGSSSTGSNNTEVVKTTRLDKVDSCTVAAHTEVVKVLVSLTKYKDDSEEQCCAF